jgi:hypothetical protein
MSWTAKVHRLGKFFCDMFNQTFVQKTLDFAFENLFLLSNFVKQN